MTSNKTIQYLFVTAFLFSLFACQPARRLPEKQYLLVKNEVIMEPQKEKGVKASSLQTYILQPANKKFLFFFHANLWLYNATSHWKSVKMKNWIRRIAGRPPVLFDYTQADASARNLSRHLNNLGYFGNQVNYKVDIVNKKARVKYFVNLPDRPYSIREVKLECLDTLVCREASEILKTSTLSKGQPYNFYLLNQERERMAREMRNRGFYYFSTDFIFYEIDSLIGNRQLDIHLIIRNPRIFVGMVGDQPVYKNLKHNRFSIRRIYVYPQFDLRSETGAWSDTLFYKSPGLENDTNAASMFLIYNNRLRIRPAALRQAIYFSRGGLYNFSAVDNTYKSLSDLPIYRYVNLEFKEADTTGINQTRLGWLDAHIQLSRTQVHGISFETEATNTGGDLGISGNVVYQNRNLFRGGELLRLRLRGAAEMQKSFGTPQQNKLFLFNTYETGVEASLTIPRFIGPVRNDYFPAHLKPRTSFNLGYNYQDRPDYRRYITNVGLTYRFRRNEFSEHQLTPLEVNGIKIYATPEFQALIDSIDDQGIRNQYSNHLIPSLRYSYIFSDQLLGKVKDFKYFRFYFESAGNLVYLVNKISGANRNLDGDYTLFGIRYAQFVKTSFDIRFFKMWDAYNVLAFRIFTGVALPYGNSNYLPFEKGFFGGGANGMRGWALRSLGPGDYSPLQGRTYNRMGDMQLETNFEYRFPIYGAFRGALFADLGNIWLVRENPLYPGGIFNPGSFYKQFALDGGLGFRLDFTYFVFRLDAALPILDPARPRGNYYVLPETRFSSLVWNFGIGYPF
ncbi:MAG: BamA/TamA family outer membrane protein [Bacteroidales bacterium]